MENKKNNKKVFWLLAIIVGLTCMGYLTTYPEALPLYQRRLFTVSYTSFSLWFNGTFVFLCIIVSINELNRYRMNGLISNLILFDLNLFYFFPGFLMNAIFETEIKFACYYAFYWLFLTVFGYIMQYFCKKTPLIVRVGGSKFTRFYNHGIVIIFSIAILLVSLVYSNFSISISSLFNASEVLEKRAASAELNIHWLIWFPILCGSMILPIWFTRAYKRKNIWQMILIAISMCAMYSIGANRVFLFMFFFAVVISVCKDDDLLIVKGLIVVLALVCIEYYLQNDYPVMNIVRRILVTPNGESRFYVDFFTNNNPDWCRQLLERWLAPMGLFSHYGQRIPAMIGNVYLGGSNCNTGLIGYSIANYGMSGLIIGPFLYTFSFMLLNRIMSKIQYKKMLQTTAVIITLEITNSFGWAEYLVLPSVLLLFYILMFLMPEDKEISRGIEDAAGEGRFY